MAFVFPDWNLFPPNDSAVVWLAIFLRVRVTASEYYPRPVGSQRSPPHFPNVMREMSPRLLLSSRTLSGSLHMTEKMAFWIFDTSNPQFDHMMAEVDLEGSDPTIPALRPNSPKEVRSLDL